MVGDCDSDNSGVDCSGVHNSATVTQSPNNISSPPTITERKLVKGAGFITIYLSEKRQFDLSNKKKYLRRTETQYGRKREDLYERVTEPAKIEGIESRSVNWRTRGNKSKYNYFILEQLDAYNKPTGNIKIIEKNKAETLGILGTEVIPNVGEKFLYYKRRNEQR